MTTLLKAVCPRLPILLFCRFDLKPGAPSFPALGAGPFSGCACNYTCLFAVLKNNILLSAKFNSEKLKFRHVETNNDVFDF